MRAIWNGFVSFGLVTIPVSVGLAQQRRDVSFRTLARETGQPVKQKRWDPVNDREVTADETVKGWEVAKGRYLPVEDEELEQFAARQEKTIRILQFVDAAEVDPVFFERAYWLEPQERAERPYKLLMTAMEGKGRAAIGRFVLSTKEHLVLLRASEGMLTLETLYYPEDIRLKDREEISDRVADVDVSDAELQMAEQLVEGLARPFEPEAYPNETRKALLDFLQAKAEGTEIDEPEEAPEPAPVIDLMAALKASLAAAGGGDADADAGDEDEAPAAKRSSSSKKDGDAQLDIEQGRLRKVEGGGEGGGAKKPARKRVSAKKTAAKGGEKPAAKKTAASRRKAS
jgi:DNA end-binding protein Ku